jgi:integrase
MATLLRRTRLCPLPNNPELEDVDGKPHIRVLDEGRRILCPLTKDGKHYHHPLKKWYGQFLDAKGRMKRVPLSANKEAARQMLAELVKKVELQKAGVTNPFEDHAKTAIGEHLAAYAESFAAKGHTKRQAEQVVFRCQSIVSGCGFRTLPDLEAEEVEKWLAKQRGLAKAEGGFGIQTSNHYLTAIKAFANWCVQTKRLAANPLQHLRRLNVEVGIRHQRRELTHDELLALIEAARVGKPRIGISGPDRAMLYLVASYTGLRASELASLTRTSFDLDAEPPTVKVAAAYSKHRREDRVPLHCDLLEELRPWLATKPDGRALWGGNWAKHYSAVDLIKYDLKHARKKWLLEAGSLADFAEREASDFLLYRDHDGRVADFHSLRHTFVTNLVKAGVLPKDAKELARHSSITLTMDRYAHVTLEDSAAALAKLPSPRSELAPTTAG